MRVRNGESLESVSDLESLFKSKGVYTLGSQFFDSTSTQYLGDIKQFTIKAEKVDDEMSLLVTIGDGNGYANKIKFKNPCEAILGIEEIPFPVDVMTEVLKANEEATSGTIEISNEGLMKLTFKEDSVESVYYLVRLSTN